MDEVVLEKIAKFFLKYSAQKEDLDRVKQYILLHFEYRTGFVGFDDNGDVTFICRWNVSPSGTTAEILDLYIREDYRNTHIIPQLVERGLWIFPSVKFIGWERGIREKDRGIRYYPVDKLLKRRSNGKFTKD
jgi:hypothetical protein